MNENLESMVIPTEFTNAVFSKKIEKGQFFIKLDEGGPDEIETSC